MNQKTNTMTSFKLRKMQRFKIVDFPCESGLKRLIVRDKKEYVRLFNETNKYSQHGAHNSVYAFNAFNANGRPDYSSARVDKILLDVDLQDFDYDDFRCYLAALSIHLFCKDHDIQHVVNKSGNGYHVYVGVDSTGIADEEKDQYIESAIDLVATVSGARVCDSCKIQATKRMIRSTGSFYIKFKKKKRGDWHDVVDEEDPLILEKKKKRDEFIKKNGFEKRYCTSLTDDVLHSGYFNIFRVSVTQNFTVHFMGTRRIILASLSAKPKVLKKQFIDELEGGFDALDDHGKPMKSIYEFLESCGIKKSEIAPCIKIMIKEKKLRYVKRFFLVVYLDSLNLSKKEIKKALSLILSKDKFFHAYIEEENRPDYIVDKRHEGMDYNITCGSMKMLGYCVDTCQMKRVLPF